MCTFAIVIKTQTTMTKKQYQELSENFWRYGDVQVDYFLPTPSGKKMESFGFLRGIGVGVNAESIIIASCGFRHAIHYSNVNFPKSNRNFQIMKAKIITTICAIVGALALFVFIPSEAPTSGTQILWSGSWLFVLILCAKGIDKYGEDEQ